MALETAVKWLNTIHSDKELGKKLLAVPEGDWNTYFSIARENGFDFSENELAEAWESAYGSNDITEVDLDNVVGGTKSVNDRLEGLVIMGVRG